MFWCHTISHELILNHIWYKEVNEQNFTCEVSCIRYNLKLIKLILTQNREVRLVLWTKTRNRKWQELNIQKITYISIF